MSAPVEDGALVANRQAILAELARAELSEVLCSSVRNTTARLALSRAETGDHDNALGHDVVKQL